MKPYEYCNKFLAAGFATKGVWEFTLTRKDRFSTIPPVQKPLGLMIVDLGIGDWMLNAGCWILDDGMSGFPWNLKPATRMKLQKSSNS